MLSLGSDLIVAMNGTALLVLRTATGAYVEATGLWEAGAEVTIEAICSVQPVNGDDMLRIPEGDRVKKILKLYSDTELRVHNEATGAQADTVTIEGEQYQVKIVEKWPTYWKAFVVRVETASIPEA